MHFLFLSFFAAAVFCFSWTPLKRVLRECGDRDFTSGFRLKGLRTFRDRGGGRSWEIWEIWTGFLLFYSLLFLFIGFFFSFFSEGCRFFRIPTDDGHVPLCSSPVNRDSICKTFDRIDSTISGAASSCVCLLCFFWFFVLAAYLVV